MSRADATTLTARSSRSYSDLVLAAGVMIIMALMILRLPTALIDTLVAVNIATGVCLLLIAIYIPTPVAFNSFPSVLLISTLFRLALSVATTRLILLEADAGNIIDAFGNFVAGGNLVVGLVVFVIITVVQFIVIAKGAERVAEVAARFTLDAMPGKQLSIDSDLRSGLIDKDEARRRRRNLEDESQLNGALDGAMKFVKGDAIASIIIVIVNLVAGLTIGMLQRDLELSTAVEIYSILTIGDGMVAQIPALLGAMAAGLVVTRTAGEEQDRHLGEMIGRQIFGQPRALLVTGLFALLLACIPGFPAFAFLVLAAVLLAMAHSAAPDIWRTLAVSFGGAEPAVEPDAIEVIDAENPERFARPLVIEISRTLESEVFSPAAQLSIQSVCLVVSEELGVPLPAPAFLLSPRLAEGNFRITVFDVEMSRGSITGGVDQSDSIEMPTDQISSVIHEALDAVLRKHAGQFLGLQEVSEILDAADQRYPALVKELLRAVNGQTIAEVLRNLVNDGIPIRNLRDILESLVEWGEREKDPGALTEFVRIGLNRYLTSLHVGDDQTLQAIVLHPALEARLRDSLHATPGGINLQLAPALATEIRENLATLVDTLSDVGEKISMHYVVLISVDLRRHLQTLLRHDFPDLPIVSYQELVMPLNIVPLGQLNVVDASRPETNLLDQP